MINWPCSLELKLIFLDLLQKTKAMKNHELIDELLYILTLNKSAPT